MTKPGGSSRIPRWLIATGVCLALLAQATLPVLHVPESAPAASLAASAPDRPVLEDATQTATHDRTTCPICLSLARSNPLIAASAPRAETCATSAPALPEAPVRCHAAVALIGHPTRAPPARSQLA